VLKDFATTDWQLAGLVCQVLWNYSIDIRSSNLTFGERESQQLVNLLTDYIGMFRNCHTVKFISSCVEFSFSRVEFTSTRVEFGGLVTALSMSRSHAILFYLVGKSFLSPSSMIFYHFAVDCLLTLTYIDLLL